VAGDALLEVSLDVQRLPDLVWSTWDHVPLDTIDPSLEFYPYLVDWTHANSVAFDGERYWVSLHNLGAVHVFAPKSPPLVIGGRDSDVMVTDGFAGQHAVLPTEGGFFVFDNREPSREDVYSRLVRYALESTPGTATPVWEWTPESDLYTPTFGNVAPKGDGTFAAWGGAGRAFELDADGAVVWQADLDVGTSFGYVHHVPAVLGATGAP
jgi:hypothetical protein